MLFNIFTGRIIMLYAELVKNMYHDGMIKNTKSLSVYFNISPFLEHVLKF